MKEKRDNPGVLLTQDGNILYAFGGNTQSIEKIEINNFKATWQTIYLQIPSLYKSECLGLILY